MTKTLSIKALQQVFVVRAMQAQDDEITLSGQAVEELNALMKLSEDLWTRITGTVSPEVQELLYAYVGLENVIDWAEGTRWDIDMTPEIAIRDARKILDKSLNVLTE